MSDHVPDLPLRMVRVTPDPVPDHPLPVGYSFRGYRPGDAAVWTEIQRESEPHLVIDDTTFRYEFGDDENLLADRCLFVVTDHGDAVGTITAWQRPYVRYDPGVMDPHDLRALAAARRAAQVEPWGLPSWLAVRPAHQGHGLGRPLLAAALRRLTREHAGCWTLVPSDRPAAIRLNIEFGFRPDLALPQTREAWQVALAADPGLARLVADGDAEGP